MRKALRRRPLRMCVLWAGCVLVGTVAASFAVDHVAVRFPYLAELQAAYQKQPAPVVVALGSSRTCGFFNVNLMNTYLADAIPQHGLQTFNAAVAAGTPVVQEDVVSVLLAGGGNPEALIVEVNPEWVHRRKNWLLPRRDVTWSNIAELAPDHFSRHGSKIIENRLLPVFARRSELRLLAWRQCHAWIGRRAPKLEAAEPEVQHPLAGYVPLIPAEPVLTASIREAQARHGVESAQKLADFAPTGSAARALERILTACERRAIPVILVDPPICSAVRKAHAVSEKAYAAYLADLLRRHPGVLYRDARAVLPDNGFIDQHHVNDYGQYLMCRHLAGHVLPEAFAAWSLETVPERAIGRRFAPTTVGLK